MQIVVEALVAATIEQVWHAYVTPEHIIAWNAASDDWHTTSAQVDLRPGGLFKSRMEAKDGSFGFDFEGTYTTVEPPHRLAYEFGGRQAEITFTQQPGGVLVRVAFDPETENPVEMQQDGWQAILNNFARHVVAG